MPTHPTPGRTVLITGAAGGLGRSFALAFAERGYRVAVADIALEGLQETAGMVEAAGAAALCTPLDVTSPSSTTQAAEAVAAFGGGHIDVVVNNAAVYATLDRSPLEDIDPDQWDRVMAVNLKGPWLMVRAASPYLGEDSSVINVASATVFSGSEHWMHYVASKGGVIAMSRVMARELGRRGITVNTLAPGFTLTEASFDHIENAEDYGIDRSALRRAAQPEDIVGTALFLAGPDSRYITGQTIIVDGGRQFI